MPPGVPLFLVTKIRNGVDLAILQTAPPAQNGHRRHTAPAVDVKEGRLVMQDVLHEVVYRPEVAAAVTCLFSEVTVLPQIAKAVLSKA